MNTRKDLRLANDAKNEFINRVKNKTMTVDYRELEPFVEALCDIAKELRKTADYPWKNTLPCDRTLYDWKQQVQNAAA